MGGQDHHCEGRQDRKLHSGTTESQPVTGSESVRDQPAGNESPAAGDIREAEHDRRDEQGPRVVREEGADGGRDPLPASKRELDGQDVPDDHGHDGDPQRQVVEAEGARARDRGDTLEQVEGQHEHEPRTEQAPGVPCARARGAGLPHVAAGAQRTR